MVFQNYLWYPLIVTMVYNLYDLIIIINLFEVIISCLVGWSSEIFILRQDVLRQIHKIHYSIPLLKGPTRIRICFAFVCKYKPENMGLMLYLRM